MLSVFGTTNRCFENHTAKNGLFLQFFQPDLDFTVEDELYGPPSSGKNSLYLYYLQRPLPPGLIKTETDISSVMNQERKLHNLGDYFVIRFGELSGINKMVVESFKNIIDEGVISSRILGTNTNERYYNNASLWGSSNRRIRKLINEMKPRKWYEFEMPSRSKVEMDEYIIKRDSVPPEELYQCIDENSNETEMMNRWDEVQRRIIERCGYVDEVMVWLTGYLESHSDKVGRSDLLKVLFENFQSAQNGKSSFTLKGFAERCRDIGFNLEKRRTGVIIYYDEHIVNDLKQRVASLLETEKEVKNESIIIEG